MSRRRVRRAWSVVCPDGRVRSFRKPTRRAAAHEAFARSVDGCRRFPDDPRRWKRRRCPQGKHSIRRRRPR